MATRRNFSKSLLIILGSLVSPSAALAIETRVTTGILYFPSEAEKVMRAQTETAEDGLKFEAPRSPREVAADIAQEELRGGNVCLRQLRQDLRVSARRSRVTELCGKVFGDAVTNALRDADRAKLHPDHVECRAEAEAREEGGRIRLTLVFRGDVVMRERAPAKLRNVGIGDELTRWGLPELEEDLGTVEGSWKQALKAGACAADDHALDRFWDRIQKRTAEARELAECRNARARDVGKIQRLQGQLRDYVPEEWVADAAGERAKELLEVPAAVGEGEGLAACKSSQARTAARLEELMSLSSRIADRHEIPALDPEKPGNRAPASSDEEGE